ncbi:IclR family transcriptional regulator [uncultured Tateyamaria sp.]|uniref:IclR family transcriptional regulator n=1 Tax=uncultured Tateyamaria sp. TaxID=455651 RepID=UPI002638C455|nr:IclR family transcriptional regulator [uncultured Tateyamaria sp.]
MAVQTVDRYRAPALDKGLDIIELLAASPAPLTQTEIGKGLGRAQNEIYRMLDTLVRRGYVAKSPEGDKYTLTLRLLAVANTYPPHRRMLDIAEPVMRQVAAALEQSLHLAVWENGEFRIAAAFSSPGNWRLSLRIGSRIGLYNTGSGKVLAAFQPEETRRRMIAEHRLVPAEQGIREKPFFTLLDQIKTQGHVSEDSAHTVGVTNLACPVLDPFGNAIAALTCPYVERIDSHSAPDRKGAIAALAAAASELGEALVGVPQIAEAGT